MTTKYIPTPYDREIVECQRNSKPLWGNETLVYNRLLAKRDGYRRGYSKRAEEEQKLVEACEALSAEFPTVEEKYAIVMPGTYFSPASSMLASQFVIRVRQALADLEAK